MFMRRLLDILLENTNIYIFMVQNYAKRGKSMKKIGAIIGIAILTVSMSMTVFAGEWKQDNKKWWYQNEDGSYPKQKWQEVDGKQYYFDENGFMVNNTITPDGFRVGEDGTFSNNIYFPSFNGIGQVNSAPVVWTRSTLIKIKDMTVFAYNRDGSNERVVQKLTTMSNGYIYKGMTLIGDWIYIQGTPVEDPQATLIRIKADGSNLQVLLRQEYRDINFNNNGIYFDYIKSYATVGEDNSFIPPIYSYNFMNFNGSGINEISKEEYEEKNNSIYKIGSTNERKKEASDAIYGFNWMSKNNEKKLTFYKINANDTRSDIYQISAGKNETYYGLGYNDNLFYYYKIVSTPTDNIWVALSKTTLCSLNVHTKEVKEYFVDEKLSPYPGYFYVNNQYIFCTSNKDDNYSLYRMNLDGSGMTKICDGNGNEKRIIGGYENFVYWGNDIVNGGV